MELTFASAHLGEILRTIVRVVLPKVRSVLLIELFPFSGWVGFDRHEAVHRAPRSTHDLEYVRAIAFFFEGSHQRFDLALNALGA